MFSIHARESRLARDDATARLSPAGDPLKEVLSGDALKVIHEQVYILLSCNRKRANRAVIEGRITPSGERKYRDVTR